MRIVFQSIDPAQVEAYSCPFPYHVACDFMQLLYMWITINSIGSEACFSVLRCGASGVVFSSGALGGGRAGSCWRGFASCRVLCVLFCYCVLLLTVRVVCSYCS